MTLDINKLLVRNPQITFGPVGRCIYCGADDVDLSREHIVPVALNGTMVLPRSSCAKCADVTKKLEQTVTRNMYGVLRIKRNYQTRNKKERPTRLSVTSATADGSVKKTEIAVADYPNVYQVALLPPPGILTGAPLSEGNPEFQLSLVGDPSEVAHAIEILGNGNIRLENTFAWGPFCRVLAKIAHGYLVAEVGCDGYFPFLPELILGRSPYLSHYVGGLSSGTAIMLNHHLTLECVPISGELYFVVNIHLFEGANMPTYRVVAAKVEDEFCLSKFDTGN